MRFPNVLATLALSLALPSRAATISLSGTVTDAVTNKGLPGVGVSLAKEGSSTTTAADGSWSIPPGGTTGLSGRDPAAAALRAVHLSIQNGRIVLRYGGRDLLGNAMSGTPSGASGGCSMAASPAVFARSADASETVDTLFFSWKDTVRLRLPIESYTGSGVSTVLDTSSMKSSDSSDAPAGMRLIPGGTFTMGSPTTEANRYSDETQHSVTVSSFYMDSTDVTQGQYQTLMKVNPSIFTSCGTTCPVEYVTWFDAVLYCNARSRQDGLDTVYSYTGMTGIYGNGVSDLAGITANLGKNGYRLPTEAQWEYAARGGTTTAYYWGNDTSTATVGKYAWYENNSGSMTHPVATKLPNAYGLYDMAGNVWKWTNDWYGTYSTTASTDPTGPSSGTFWVNRGGCWYYAATSLRSAARNYGAPGNRYYGSGFRCVRPGPPDL